MVPVPNVIEFRRVARRALRSPITWALALIPAVATAQVVNFDFGDGRHGSFTAPAGETTIQDLWSQIRSADDGAYDPALDAQVPNLENLTIPNGAVLTVSEYTGGADSTVDPTLGGVLRLKVRGTLTIEAGGAIDASGKGYRGGTMEGPMPGLIGQQGDSWGVGGNISGEANRGGGGGGFGETNGGGNPGSGGGGGHREAGTRGTTGMGAATGGLGGLAYDTVATALGQGFRDTFPFPRFGSGGGRGGQDANFSNTLALGGNGGGIIIIEAREIINDGAIRADGAVGGSGLSGGGGGAGGSILIQSTSDAHGTVAAAGGNGGVGTVLGNDGGSGGIGIELWDARFAVTTAVDGQGSVTLSPAGGLYGANAEVEVTAVPEAGWRFDHWEGDLTGSANPATLTMDDSKSVTAFFVEQAQIAVTPATRDIGPGGGNLAFEVGVSNNSDAVDWIAEVETGADFITITSGSSGTNEGAIALSIGRNMIGESRSGTLAISSPDVPGDPIIVTVNQGPATPTLSVSPATQTVEAAGAELVIQVQNAGTGTFDWTATVLSGQSFVSITSGGTGTNDGTFVLTVAENTLAVQRSATISVSAPGALSSPTEITLVQQAGVPLLQVTPSSQVIGSAAGPAAINVNNGGSGTMNWTASVVQGAEFATVSSGASGTDAGIVSVTFTNNATMENRAATIRVESPDAVNSPVEVTVTQTSQEAVLQVLPTTQNVGSEGGTAEYQVDNAGTGVMNWTASIVTGANFVTLTSGTSGSNEGTITVTAAANTGVEDRTATIRVAAPGAANSPQIITLVQASRTPLLRVVPAEQSIGSNGGAINITIENAGTGTLNWTASLAEGAEFLSITSASSGTGDGSIQITVAPNPDAESRTGTIRVEAPGAEGNPQIATILQLGCGILAQPRNLSATDGDLPDSVQLIWSAVPNAAQYEIFRSPIDSPERLELIGTSTEPSFSDTRTEKPDYELLNRGCFNPGEFLISPFIYFYEVRAVNACGTSEPSAQTTGYRGLPVGDAEDDAESPAAKTSFTPVVLPSLRDGQVHVGQADTIALRLYHPDGIDPASVWGQIDGKPLGEDAIVWAPVNAGDDTDGWATIATAAGAHAAAFTMDVGARSWNGETIGTSQTFVQTAAAKKALPDDVAVLPYAPTGDDEGLFFEGRGDVFEIVPETLFDAPRQIQIPLPESARNDTVALYYYGVDDHGAAWYPADAVTGWLSAPVTFSEDGQYLEVWVRHGGLVRVGIVPAPRVSAAMPGLVAPGDYGTLALLLFTGAALALFGRTRRNRA